VQVFADELDAPRWLAITPEGDVLVTETRRDRILRLVDADHDGVADHRETFASRANGLDIPFGMTFANFDGRRVFYLGNTDEIRRYDYRRRLHGKGERIAELPGGGYHQHWTRNVVVTPEGDRLFVSVGSRSNDDPEPPPRASILVMGLDGSNRRVFASGLRNPVGLAFQPRTGALYATVNERDGLGDDLVPDYLARIEDGAFYGWPYAYLDPSHLDPRHAPDGRSPRPELVARTRTPEVLFQAHSAPLGLAFYPGGPFPARYHGGAFVAFRGSWNRERGTGYEVVFVPFDAAGAPLGTYEAFVTGFLLEPSAPTTWGRPVGVAVLPDGSLLFTEEANGRIFRVAYSNGD
jgi:glucose/arabinose dehydrogenase